MSIDICNGPVPTGLPACDPGYNTDLSTIIVQDVFDRFGVDWKHRLPEFEKAAKEGKLRLDHHHETRYVEAGKTLKPYNTTLEVNGKISYYLFIELKRGPSKAVQKKRKKK